MIAKIILLAVAIGCFAASLAGLKHFDEDTEVAGTALLSLAAFFSLLCAVVAFCMIVSEGIS